MITDQDKAKAKRFINEVLNTGRWEELDQYLEPDGVDHVVPPGYPKGSEGFKQFFQMFRTAFPDLNYTVEETLGEGDLLAQRVTGRGTMKGEFLGMQPTGKHAEWEELHLVRVKDGRFVEHWGNVDQMSMLIQLGLAPAPGA